MVNDGRGGVPAAAERHDLNGDVGEFGYLAEAVRLSAHHRAAAHQPPQRRLVNDGRNLRHECVS